MIVCNIQTYLQVGFWCFIAGVFVGGGTLLYIAERRIKELKKEMATNE